MHYFQFNIADWIAGTTHLDTEEEFCYFKLILEYYNKEQPLDLDLSKLARRIRFVGKEEIIENILKEFFSETKKGWKNERCDKEIRTYRKRADTARNNGKKGGRRKEPSGLGLGTQREPSGNPERTQDLANHKPLTNNHKPITSNQLKVKEAEASFETFWKLTKFPKRRQDTKGDLKKKYIAIVKDGTKPEDILFASDIFADVHKGDEYAIGMRKFMVKETIEQYLTEDVSKQAAPVKAPTVWDIAIEKAKEIDKARALQKLNGNN